MKNNKVMKRLLGLLLFVVCVIVIGYYYSDLPTEPTGITGYDYVFKKQNGKVLMGVKSTMGVSAGEVIIAPQYDKITTGFNNGAFIVYQGSDAKVIGKKGKFAVRGFSIIPESITFLGNKFNAGFSFVPGPGFRMKSQEGENLWWFGYAFSFGDMDELIPGCNGAIFKKNGKYGYFENKVKLDGSVLLQKYETVKKFNKTVEEKYDALFEVINYALSDKYYLLARSGNKWFVLNSKGEIIKRHHPKVSSSLLNIPMTKNFQETYTNPLQHIARFGEKNAGLFIFGISLADWNSANVWESYFN